MKRNLVSRKGWFCCGTKKRPTAFDREKGENVTSELGDGLSGFAVFGVDDGVVVVHTSG